MYTIWHTGYNTCNIGDRTVSWEGSPKIVYVFTCPKLLMDICSHATTLNNSLYMVWYGMVWYGMVWYGMVQYNSD